MKRVDSAELDAVAAWRRELKFVYPGADPHKIARLLELNAEPINFGQAEVSEVHSIYFDDQHLSSCAESLAGISRRVKLRVRWYDAPFAAGQMFFEMKRRVGHQSEKTRTLFDLGGSLSSISYRALRDGLQEELDEVQAGWLDLRGEPSMLISYRRRHFRHRESGTRITLDWGLHAFEQLGARAPNRDWLVESDGRVVIEIKVPVGGEAAARHVFAPLRLRVSRSSKYVHCCTRAGWVQLPEDHD